MAKDPAKGKGKTKSKAAEPVEEIEELEEETFEEDDDLDDLDDTDEDESEDEDDDLEEVEDEDEAPAPKKGKGKATKSTTKKAPAREKIEFGSSWLAEHASEKTGVKVDARSLRILLRKLAKDGTIGEGRDDKSRYSWTGPKDAEVVAVVKAIKGGALEKTKSDGLAAARAAKLAKKEAAEKAAAEEAAAAAKAAKKGSKGDKAKKAKK